MGFPHYIPPGKKTERSNGLDPLLLVYDGDRQAPLDLSNLLLEGTDLDPDTWLTRHTSIYQHSHIGKPAHHRAEDLLDPKDTSRGICRCVPDPMDLE